jgi:hypothetical protein
MICWVLACAVGLQAADALKKAGNEMMERQDTKGALVTFEKARHDRHGDRLEELYRQELASRT